MPIAPAVTQSALTLASAVISARGVGIAADYEAAGLEAQARLARLQARQALEAGESAAVAQGLETSRLAGAQRAGFASQGVLVDQDTAGLVVQQTLELGRRDMDTIRLNAWRQAMGLRMEAAGLVSDANMTRLAAEVRQRDIYASGVLQSIRDFRSLSGDRIGTVEQTEPEAVRSDVDLAREEIFYGRR